ncbi:ferrous iron transport protein A [Campylobacter iguaniorum]|uniref:Ferrous iron transport protein A n=1 Tax=Campylobacter iguaniorum TaxID=1244531 RepID=A0A076FCM6_9BACT|nr:FeoA family protein [Campylobacter iguaniorum]AII15152.1 ferrous iron transport protein A [Campylobacter iguaniorum]ALV25020.1 ferrous iron transport protein A [Campylobacter iguaniorum]ANE36281.1 ferrous iron transport protein A [Campylobacter iguaniorum]
MNLTELDKDQKAILKSIDGEQSTKRRLRSFGLDVGSQIQIKQKSISDLNIELSSEFGLIALRKEEAQMIECEPIKQ